MFDGIKNLLSRFRNSTAGAQWKPAMGISSAGKSVNERTSMQITAVYACVRILSESVAQLPFNLYEYVEGGKTKAIKHSLYRILHDEPNPEMSSFIFREVLMTHLLLWGNAYAQIIRNNRGEVVALYPLMPNKMTVDRDINTHEIIYKYQHSVQDEANTLKETSVTLKARDVFHIVGLGFDGLVGYSPIAMAKNAIGMSMACEEYGSKFFNNGARPGGVLEHPGHVQDYEKLKESWQSQFGGSGNSGKIAILEEGMKYSPIAISPNEAQFLETRKFQLNEIARIFRIPPHMIGDLDKSSFSNIEQQSLEYVKYTLEPWLVRWEQEVQRKLLVGEEKLKYFSQFKLEGLLRGDYESRMKGYSIGIQNGFMSPNDIRELENLDMIPKEEGGFTYMVNGNMIPLKYAGVNYGKSDNINNVKNKTKYKKFSLKGDNENAKVLELEKPPDKE